MSVSAATLACKRAFDIYILEKVLPCIDLLLMGRYMTVIALFENRDARGQGHKYGAI